MLTKTQIKWFGKKIALDASTYAHGVTEEDMRQLLQGYSDDTIDGATFTADDLWAVEQEANRQYWRVAAFLGYEEGMRDTFPGTESLWPRWDSKGEVIENPNQSKEEN